MKGWGSMEDFSKISHFHCSRDHFIPRHANQSGLFLNNRHYFLTFPSFIASSPYTLTILPWISVWWTFLVFKNRITNCISQVAGFSIFFLIFNDYIEWGEKNDDTAQRNTRVLLDILKTPDLYRKWTLHLRDRYSRSVLTVWTHLVTSGPAAYLPPICNSPFCQWVALL